MSDAPEPRRRFTLADAMLFVAATAPGVAGLRAGWVEAPAVRVGLVVPVLTAWTAAWLAARLRRPRPPRTRLARQPGTAAAVAALLAVAGNAVLFLGSPLVSDYVTHTGYLTVRLHAFLFYCLDDVGLAVAAAWLALALAGAWRPEPSWLDRTGRALGAGWVAVYVLTGIGFF